MNEEKYNGYKNRSTWLAVIHLENTSNEVFKEAVKLADKYKELRVELTKILRTTRIDEETNYKQKDMDLEEVIKHFTY